jgi:site-specific DNA recombinase
VITRAAIYARVSSQAQRDKHTIENQLRVLPVYVASQGWTVVGTYIDDGRSAKAGKLEARDGFAALLRDAELGKFDVVVVVDVDRLTRTDSIEERALILGPFQRLGIDIVTPSGGRLDMRTMFGELWITIQALGAAEENRKRAERIKAGKLRAIAEGRKPAGPTPYGHSYSRETGTWSIDEAAAAIVREIFARVAAGEPCIRIADDLARRNASPAPRTGWSKQGVYRIVRKRSSIGEWDADKRRGAVIRIPSIITEREWQEAQRALMLHRKRGLRRTKHIYLLEGLATCAECGRKMMIRSACGSIGKTTGRRSLAAYICRGRKIERVCFAPVAPSVDLDERVWTALCAELEQPDLLQALADVGRDRANDARDWASDADDYRAKLLRLEKIEAEAMARYRRGQISQGALDAELEAIGRERVIFREQLATAERALGATLSAQERLRAAGDTLAQLRAALPLARPDQRRALLRELVHAVVIDKGRARLDVRLLRLAPSAKRTDAPASLALVNAPGYRMTHGAALRIRLVA